MAIVVALWVVVVVVSMPWAAIRAKRKGYPFVLWFVLAFFFGFAAVLATYLLPTKARGESIASAAGKSVATGAISLGVGARDAVRRESPGMAKGAGGALARAAVNSAAGVRETLKANTSESTTMTTTPQSRSEKFGRFVARTALDATEGAKKAMAAAKEEREAQRQGSGAVDETVSDPEGSGEH